MTKLLESGQLKWVTKDGWGELPDPRKQRKFVYFTGEGKEPAEGGGFAKYSFESVNLVPSQGGISIARLVRRIYDDGRESTSFFIFLVPHIEEASGSPCAGAFAQYDESGDLVYKPDFKSGIGSRAQIPDYIKAGYSNTGSIPARIDFQATVTSFLTQPLQKKFGNPSLILPKTG